jgi:hypothetical protein
MPSSLAYCQKALSFTDSTGSPTRVGERALGMISQVMMRMGNLNSAQKHANRAQEYAEALGAIFPQAKSLYTQARCQILSAKFSKAQILIKDATQLLTSCGLEACTLHLKLQNLAAEVHLLRTEYLESHYIQIPIAATSKPKSYISIVANSSIALIDIARGIDSYSIRKNLDQCQLHCEPFYGFQQTQLKFYTDSQFAVLCLRDSDISTANEIFTRYFFDSQHLSMDRAIFCLERLADLSTGINSSQTTIGWAGIFLVLALRSRDKLAIMKAFCCLGQISYAYVQGDDDTALSLFNVALEGFIFMDIHQWRADCMVRIGDIWGSHGELLRAVGLWKATRPLFARSSQAKDVSQIDAKLTMVEALISEHHEKQLLHLTELNVPAGVSTVTDLEKSQDPISEEEDQQLVDRNQKVLEIGV